MGLIVTSAMQRLIPPDAAVQLYYKLDETSAPLKNSGALGALDATLVSGSAGIFQRTGILGRCLGVSGASDYATANTAVGNLAGVWTLEGWVNLTAYVAAFSHLVGKQYRGDGTWTSPFAAIDIQLTNAADGSWQVVVTVAGVGKTIAVGAPYKMPLNQWLHIGASFDQNTVRAYFSGEPCGSVAAGSNVNTDYGTNGRWLFGGNPAGTTERLNGRLNHWMFHNVLRNDAWFHARYKTMLGLFE